MLSDIPSQAAPLSCHTIILFQRAH